MITFDDLEVMTAAEKVLIPLTFPSPLQRGQLDAWLSRSKGGPPARGALHRVLVVRDGAIPAFTLCSRDLTAEWPKGGRAFVLVAYANQVLAKGAERVVR